MEISPKHLSVGLGRILDGSQNWLRLIDFRLAVVLGVSVFLLATGVNPVKGGVAPADLREGSLGAASLNATSHPHSALRVQSQPRWEEPSSSTRVDPAIANRLSHGTLTRAVFTGNPLTRAHFFTDSGKKVP